MVRIILLAVFLFFLLSGNHCMGITLPWSTTYNCSDWNRYDVPLICDGLERNGNWVALPENLYEQITIRANYPDGNGGKGQRHWVGNGTNNNSGGIRIRFTTPQEKFWIRWYMRWQKGFRKFGQYKALYFFGPQGSNGPALNFFYPEDGMSFEYLDSGNIVCSNCGWGRDFYANGVSDGSWVYVEAMIDIPGGKINLWIGRFRRQVIRASNVRFKESAVSYLVLGDNQKDVANSKSMYIDYDDFAISSKNYIGPFKIVTNPSFLILLLGGN